jgi:hypothetical protein
MAEWVASGLGFCLNHIEEAFGLFFNLKGQPEEYIEFDTAALLRSNFKDRIAALKEGVMGTIFTPNEARNLEGLDSKPYGDEPRAQQQLVPISAAAGIPAGPPGGKTIIPPSPPAPPAPTQPGAPQPQKTEKGPGPPRSLTDARRDRNARELLRRFERLRRKDDQRPSA